MSEWRNRIVKEGAVDPAEIRNNPRNWRVHPKLQRQTVEDSLGAIGWIQKPIINLTTGHLIDGHLRVAAALERGERSVPVCYVELTIDEERAALASLDPLAGMAVTDSEMLGELLEGLNIGEGPLNNLFEELRDQASSGVLAANTPSEERAIGTVPLVKAALLVSDLLTVENALSATGLMNRGDALITICKAYLHEHSKGSHDPKPEDGAALLAAAADPAPDRDGNPRRIRKGIRRGLQRDPAGGRVRDKAGKD